MLSRIIRVFICVCILFILFPTSSGLTDTRPVKVGVAENPPIAFRDANGKFRGFSVEVLEFIAAKEGWNIEYVFGTLKECLKRLDNGEIDVQVYIAYSEKRALIYDYTQESLLTNWGAVYTWPGSGIVNIIDINGKRVAVLGKSIHVTAFEELTDSFGLVFEKIEINNPAEGFKLASDKSVDAVITHRLFGLRSAKQFNLEKTQIIFNPIEIRYAMPKGKNADLIVAIDKHLKILKSDKQSIFYQLFNSAFKLETPIRSMPKWIYWALGLSFFVIILLFVLNRTLNRLVIERTKSLHAEKVRRNLEKQLQHSQKLESLGVLAGGIAHDFNNLLMGIMGNVGMARMKMSPEAPSYIHIDRIETAAERAADLTNQMLAYSGKGKFVVNVINLTTVLKEMSHLLQVTTGKNVVLKYDLDKDLPVIEADPSQLHQILMNLLTNASDSLGGKSGDVIVSTGVEVCDKACLSEFQFGDELSEGKYVYLEVSDTGSGMDDKTIERIFDPFFSTKEGGRGLGLSAVIGIVQGHKGAIKVISEPGRGTTFKLLFPASEKTAEEIVEERLALGDYRGEGTILVVDDEEGVRDIAASILDEFGFEVLLARDGEEALELFKERADEISLVLLDLSMPGMGGIEAFRHLKQHWDDVKVILSSGYTEEDAISSFTGQGLADFIQKPYKPEELISKVRKVLEV